jgi:hypothetical protein
MLVSRVICDFDKDGFMIEYGPAARYSPRYLVVDIEHAWGLAQDQGRNIAKYNAQAGMSQRLVPLTRAAVRTN